MKIKGIVYYIIGFLIAVSIGYYINQIVGALAVFVIYPILSGIIAFFFGLAGGDPNEKSIYEKRKKE